MPSFSPKLIMLFEDNAVAFHRWAMNPKNDGALKGQRFTATFLIIGMFETLVPTLELA